MAISYKFIDKPRTFDEGANCLEHEIYPLLQEFWTMQGEKFYGKPLQFNAPAFVNLWVMNGLALVIAYDDKVPVGLFIGIKFNPMLFESTILQVETVYGKDISIENGLMEYVASITPILGVDEIFIQRDMNRYNLCPAGWKSAPAYEITRLTK